MQNRRKPSKSAKSKNIELWHAGEQRTKAPNPEMPFGGSPSFDFALFRQSFDFALYGT